MRQKFYILECAVCGWRIIDNSWTDYGSDDPYFQEAELKHFSSPNDDGIKFEELTAVLKERHSLLYEMSPRRFELYIGDVFRHLGWETLVTQQSADGGADLILLRDGAAHRIVECKKYEEGRKIGVRYIRSLVGATFDFAVKKATLITTSEFTRPAREYAVRRKQLDGFEVDLVVASEILEELDVRNTSLPRLDRIDESILRALEAADSD